MNFVILYVFFLFFLDNTDLVKILLENGLNINVIDNLTKVDPNAIKLEYWNHCTPLHWAINRGNIDFSFKLIFFLKN